MKKLLIIFAVAILFPLTLQAETCPVCGQEIPTISTIQVEKYPDGQTKTWTETTTDSHGTILSKRVDSYTYKDGVINKINQKKYSDKELIKETEITHYTDKAPTVKDIEVIKEKEVIK